MLIVEYTKNMKTNVPTVNVHRGAFRNQSSRYNRDLLESYQQFSEAVARGCSIKKVFLEISQNTQEKTCVRVSGTGVFL